MSRVPAGADQVQGTVVSRRALLDALVALKAHLSGITVVGAQAVYLRSSDSPYAVASSTFDADLAFEPTFVGDEPRIDEVMQALGFEVPQGDDIGTWTRNEQVGDLVVSIPVDLLVPSLLAGRKGRSANVPPYPKKTFRSIPGIEAVMYDRSPLTVQSLEPEIDSRAITVQVADVASLLIAKAYKLKDRIDNGERKPDRLTDKDAGDVLRLFAASDPEEVRTRFGQLQAIQNISEVVENGRTWLVEQFGRDNAPGVRMATAALARAGDPPGPVATSWIAVFKDS